MSKIQARAKVKIPFGMLDEYKQYVSEFINRIKEKDNGTLQFDWFISSDKKEVEILEVYESSEAALKHNENLDELQVTIFKKFGAPYSLTIYGDPSPKLMEKVKASELDVKIFHFLQGLQMSESKWVMIARTKNPYQKFKSKYDYKSLFTTVIYSDVMKVLIKKLDF